MGQRDFRQLGILKYHFSDTFDKEQRRKYELAEEEFLNSETGKEVVLNVLLGSVEYASEALQNELRGMIYFNTSYCGKLDIVELLQVYFSTGLPVDIIFDIIRRNSDLSMRQIRVKLEAKANGGNFNFFDVVQASDLYTEEEFITEEFIKRFDLESNDSAEFLALKTYLDMGLTVRHFYVLLMLGRLDFIEECKSLDAKFNIGMLLNLYKNLRYTSCRSKYWCFDKLLEILKFDGRERRNTYLKENLEGYNGNLLSAAVSRKSGKKVDSSLYKVPICNVAEADMRSLFMETGCYYYSNEWGTETDKYVLLTTQEVIDLLNKQYTGSCLALILRQLDNVYYTPDVTKASARGTKLYYTDMVASKDIAIPTFSSFLRDQLGYSLYLFKDEDRYNWARTIEEYAEKMQLSRSQYGTSKQKYLNKLVGNDTCYSVSISSLQEFFDGLER